MYDSAPGPDRPFLPDQLNPCWAGPGGGDDKAGGMRCLPYAMILGGFQSGAASLFTAVYKHPLVLKVCLSGAGGVLWPLRRGAYMGAWGDRVCISTRWCSQGCVCYGPVLASGGVAGGAVGCGVLSFRAHSTCTGTCGMVLLMQLVARAVAAYASD